MQLSTVTKDNNNAVSNAGVDSRLLQKLESKFTSEQQQLFVQSFALYAQCKDKSAFLISLDAVWEWLGFSRKDAAKRVIQSNFQPDIHYKILLHQNVEQLQGGHNKETILMTVDTFKSLCMLTNTDKAKVVRQYYITLEEVVQEYLDETIQQQVRRSKEQAMLEYNHLKHTNYLGVFNYNGETFAKYGWTNDIYKRWKDHISSYGENFYLHAIVECPENILLEKQFSKHPDIAARRVERVINKKNHIELVKLDDKFNVEDAKKILLTIKKYMMATMLEYKQMEQERNHELEKERMKHLERMREMEVELEKVKLEMKRLDVMQTHPSVPTPEPPVSQQQVKFGSKAVLQYTLDNTFVTRHKSQTDAAKACGGNTKSIRFVCSGKYKAHKGFMWKFAPVE